jgi:hypothetical protein
MIKKALIVFSLVVTCFGLSAQQDSSAVRFIQFSGIVITGDSLNNVPYAHIRVKGTNRGTVSNHDGFFSFVAKPGEELIFSAVGFKDSHFKIPDSLDKEKYSWIQMMQNDTILLVETVIYPWPTYDDLKYAIVNLDVPENDYDRAMKNLEIQKIKELALEMPMDGSMNFRNQIQNVVSTNYYNGQYMPNNLLNPFAWVKFLEAWREGKFFNNKE